MRKVNLKNASFESIISKNVNDTNRIRFTKIIDANNLDISSLENGFIFLYATWAPTLAIFSFIMEVVGEIEFDQLNVVAIDIDIISKEYFDKTLKIKSNAKGETLWIKNGEIFDRIEVYPDKWGERVKHNIVNIITTK